MRVALVAKAHFDTIAPLVRHLAEYMDVELVIIASGTRHVESLLDMDLVGCPEGLIQDQIRVEGMIGAGSREALGSKVRLTVFRFPSLKFLSLRNIRLCLRLCQYLREKHFDCIHFNGILGLFHVFYYFFIPGVPKVQTIHDSSSHSGEADIRHEINRWLLTLQNSTLIVPSEFAARELAEVYRVDKAKIKVVPFGPLTLGPDAGPQQDSPEPEILFWGRISPYKGIEYLIQAFALVQKRMPMARLIIAGKGQPTFDTAAIQRDPSISWFNRFIPIDELQYLIRRAWVVAVPYTDATQSGVVMTAFAHGKPVVASAVGGIPEMVRPGITGLLVPPRDVQALADALVKLLEDAPRRATMKANILDLCNNEYSWAKIAGRIHDVYEKVMNPCV